MTLLETLKAEEISERIRWQSGRVHPLQSGYLYQEIIQTARYRYFERVEWVVICLMMSSKNQLSADFRLRILQNQLYLGYIYISQVFKAIKALVVVAGFKNVQKYSKSSLITVMKTKDG